MRKTYTFTLHLPEFYELNSELEDRIFEAHCDDGLLCYFNRSVYIIFDREDCSLENAIKSAIDSLEKIGIFSCDSNFNYKIPAKVSLLRMETRKNSL